MANVKFNRGLRSTIEDSQTLTYNEVSIGRETADNSWDSIYLGTALVGTSMLGLMRPQKMQTPTYTYPQGQSATISWAEATIGTGEGNIASGVITTDVVSGSPITTVRKLVDYATASVSGYAASATDSEILTAKATASLISSAGGYYSAGGWNYTPQGGSATGWDTWTALHSIDSGKNFQFTLPIAVTSGDNYNPATDTTHLVTPAQAVQFAGDNDIYHKSGDWGTGANWNTYTAQAYKGNTLLTDSTTPTASAYALSFTVPVETGNIVKHGETTPDYYDNHLPTSKAVATFVENYFSTIAGGMRYCGTIGADGKLPSGSLAPYKPGDVFIATADITLGGTKVADAGDMIVIRTLASGVESVEAGTSINDSTKIAQYDVFERNIDGAVTAVNNLATNKMVVGDAADSKTVKTVDFVTADITNTDIVIAHTVGQTTETVSVADSLIWHEL